MSDKELNNKIERKNKLRDEAKTQLKNSNIVLAICTGMFFISGLIGLIVSSFTPLILGGLFVGVGVSQSFATSLVYVLPRFKKANKLSEEIHSENHLRRQYERRVDWEETLKAAEAKKDKRIEEVDIAELKPSVTPVDVAKPKIERVLFEQIDRELNNSKVIQPGFGDFDLVKDGENVISYHEAKNEQNDVEHSR